MNFKNEDLLLDSNGVEQKITIVLLEDDSFSWSLNKAKHHLHSSLVFSVLD